MWNSSRLFRTGGTYGWWSPAAHPPGVWLWLHQPSCSRMIVPDGVCGASGRHGIVVHRNEIG